MLCLLLYLFYLQNCSDDVIESKRFEFYSEWIFPNYREVSVPMSQAPKKSRRHPIGERSRNLSQALLNSASVEMSTPPQKTRLPWMFAQAFLEPMPNCKEVLVSQRCDR